MNWRSGQEVLLDTIDVDGSEIEDRGYDAAGRLTSVDRPTVDESRSYDSGGRLATIGNGAVGDLSYSYDANDNKTSETWTGVMASYSFTTQNSGQWSEGYDEEDRFRNFIQSGQSKNYELARNEIGVLTDRKLNGIAQSRTHSDSWETSNVGTDSQQYDIDGQMTTSTPA